MKTQMMRFVMVAFVMATFSFVGSYAADKYEVVANKTSLKWLGKKVTGEHFGKIAVKSGMVTVDGTNISGGEFVIDMNSITCVDIEDAGYNKKLIGHLKSDDFFSVDKHPTASFKITSVKSGENGKATVMADLTIKGITKPISFPATVSFNGDMMSAKAEITVDRTKYDVKYGSGSFFDGLGDKMIYDDFVMTLDLSAKKS